MSPDFLILQATDKPAPPPATESLHGPFLEAAVPPWLFDASAPRKAEFKQARTVLPNWYSTMAPAQRRILHESYRRSFSTQTRLDQTMAAFKDIDAFARPMLIQALKSRFQVEVDVDKTLLCLRRPIRAGILGEEIGTYESLTLPLLQAALHNFESDECRYGAFHRSSGFAIRNPATEVYTAVPVNVSVRNFLGLCRELDIGAKYQAYLDSFFHPENPKAEARLRRRFIASQKTAMRAAADRALLTKDILPEDHAMIISVIRGERHPRIGRNQVWFQDLSLMRHRLVGCVAFKIAERDRPTEAVILYVPNDPVHPLKRYTGTQMQSTFKRLLTARVQGQSTDIEPTPYQRFLSQFLPYEKRPYYFSQFVKVADSASDWLTSPWRKILEATLTAIEIWETSPKHAKRVTEPDPYIAAALMPHVQAFPWAANSDLWTYLYEKHREKVFADARCHAVPTADVDASARNAKLSGLLQFGLLALNVASMFVPVLGEIMLVVMAGQLLFETIEGVVEWSEGDRHAAKAHFVDVAENLAQIAVMAAAGAGFKRLTAVKPEPLIEQLHPVTLPTGETRLWKPDFSGYEQQLTLSGSVRPNAQGQYQIDGKICFRHGGRFYEQIRDESTGQWQLKHPTDADAYQPVLSHNGQGAWRLALEQPMNWERLKLLRCMGHITDDFSDESLLMLADISAVSDNALRKMHMDHLPPPPELHDAMRLFRADRGARQMIEQLRGARPIDEGYLYALPLITEMPDWPADRILEFFVGAEGEGSSIRYGAQTTLSGFDRKPVIRISRAQALNGEMPARILAALQENEVRQLLGPADAQFHPARPDAFSRRLADYAHTRQSAIFDSLYRGSEPLGIRGRILQRECPGLSNAAAQDVLEHATAAELARMDAAGRSPLKMLEEARWHARQGRQVRAFAGLHSENLASADSRRLALFALEQLPGWPQTLRLEIREGSTTGALLDSIGEPAAPVKRYLVKDGPAYQAFGDRAEALNRLSSARDSFYHSLLRALPDDIRLAIDLPEGSPGSELQHKIIGSAHAHRRQAAHVLAPQAKAFKPPVRVSARLKGYYASGRGPNLASSLESRVAHLYPQARQAEAFLTQQRGRSHAQIFSELEFRREDRERLDTTLEQWQASPTGSQAALHRAQVAQALRNAWRNGPLAGQEVEAGRLSLVCDTPLPALSTRFAHIHELSVTGLGITDSNADSFLAAFPNVTDLSIGELGQQADGPMSVAGALTTLPEAVGRMPGLTRLRFSTDAPLLAPSFSQRLSSLATLEALRIDYSGVDSTSLHELDLTPLTRLRSLRIDAPRALWRWPAYVERLEHLERLDLTHTLIETLPESLYHEHEQLWAGLTLDWSRVTPATFRRAYEYVSQYSGPLGHLLDLHQMVGEFCRAELDTMAPMPSFTDPLSAAFNAAWVTPQARVTAIEQLRAEHDAIFAVFYTPAVRHGTRYAALRRQWSTGPNADVVNALKTNWYGMVRQRYGLTANVATFDLPVTRSGHAISPATDLITELPPLPAGSFSHVRTVRLGRLDVPIEQARHFLRAFSHVELLEFSGNAFTELPFVPDELSALTHLDASGNRIEVTPVVQRQINGLQRLRRLNLSNNPLGNIDVSLLSRLRALSLRSTQLRTWPAGAENLPRLAWLDLRDNLISSLPPSVLTHPDALMRANLAGNLFSREGEASLHAALQRIEQQRGLGQGTLARFAAEPVPEAFPPAETGWSFIDLMLPLPEAATVLQGQTGPSTQLQRLTRIMPVGQARLHLQNLRASGASDAQIEARITEWQHLCEALVRLANDWLYTREVRTDTYRVNARDRSVAARRLFEAWLDGLTEHVDRTRLDLDFQDLQTGDLPELTVPIPAVRTLDLSRVGMTTRGLDGFLGAFPNVETLYISGNPLVSVPGPVLRMQHLEHLEMQYCDLADATDLYPLMARARLRRLDVGYNQLRVFNPPDFGAVQTLDLRYNHLTAWPGRVFEAPQLHSLNLSGNELTHIPGELFSGDHERLSQGTDLSENHRLSLSALQDMRRYAREQSALHVLGMSRRHIETMIDTYVFGDLFGGAEPVGPPEDNVGNVDLDDPGAAVLPVEEVLDPVNDVAPRSRDPWLRHSAVTLAARRADIWAQLAQEPDHQRFFQLLRLLRDTDDFRLVPADLTRRMWDVMQAATENSELRQLLFLGAESHGTCPDGRILTFSDMEVRVSVYRALHDIPVHRMALKGRALLRLSRQLFRLDRIETLADAAGRGRDRAEVRLKYRIGLTGGWGDGVDLPGQPAYMLYGEPLSGELLNQTRASILEAERTDALPLSMIARDYWITYLEERLPVEMQAIDSAVDQQRQERWSVLDDRLSRGEIDARAYDRELVDLGKAMERLLTQKRLELTRREIVDLQSFADETEEGDRVTPTPGPSNRP